MQEERQIWPRLFQLPKTDKFPVSVCRLEADAWHEQGLGLAWCERRDSTDETWLLVAHEQRPTETLLQCLIRAPLSFRKQNLLLFCAATDEHLTVTPLGEETDGAEDNTNVSRVAICFQELAGCAVVCDFLAYAAHTWAPGVTVALQFASANNAASGEVDLELIIQPPPLPPLPTSANADAVVKTISQALKTALGREFLAIYLDQQNYLDHMHELFVEMEHSIGNGPSIGSGPSNANGDGSSNGDDRTDGNDSTVGSSTDPGISPLQRIRTLWALSDIMKQYFLVGDGFLIDCMVSSDQFVKVIGILEYDRTFGSRKANFRDYYCNHTELKQVVVINDMPVLEKIRRTFRLQLLRDILVRSADDFPFQILKTLIYINQVEIIDSLQNSSTFCDDLFGLFEDGDGDESVDESTDSAAATSQRPLETHTCKKELRQQGLKFINEVIKISKTFTMHQMRVLYENLTDFGLFDILNYAMAEDQPLGPKILVLESLGVLLDFDPQLAARHFRPTIQTLTQLICAAHGPASDADSTPSMVCAMQIQACELLKKLMAEEPKLTAETFFKKVSQHLAEASDALSAETVQHILDIVSFAYMRVPTRTIQLSIEHNLWSRLASSRLIETSSRNALPESGVFIALIKAVQTAIHPTAVDENDELVKQSRQLIETELIGKILDFLTAIGNVNQMVHSSCLNLLHLIVEGFRRGEPQFELMAHWLACEKRQDLAKLSEEIPVLKEILELADASADGANRDSTRARDVATTPSGTRMRPANRKRSFGSNYFPGKPGVTASAAAASQLPRTTFANSLHSPQHAPIDEVDSEEMSASVPLGGLGSRSEENQEDSYLLTAEDSLFLGNIGELLGRGEELHTEYSEESPGISPTSPTATNPSYWDHSSIEPGPAGKRRAILLQRAMPGPAEPHESDYF